MPRVNRQQGVFQSRVGASEPAVQSTDLVDAMSEQANRIAVTQRHVSRGVGRQQLAGESK